MQKIGVFVCWCGSNIAGTVDVGRVVEAVRQEPGVAFAADYQYMCSDSGQNLIKSAVKEHGLTGIVVCSCSPRMHEATFKKTAAAAGLNPYMVEIANIREHCSWIHKNMEEATEKAIVLARAAIAKVLKDAPLTSGTTEVTKRALVIGGGIAGIQTALDIAEAGFAVDIVEKQPTIGGRMAQLDKTFPTLDCSACILTPKMVDAGANENIELFTYSEVESVKGFVGNFTVTIRKKARSVRADLCTGCGECTEKCPSRKAKNEFNMGMDTRGAIYIPYAQAVPKIAVIDREHCLHFKTGKCGLCERTCSAKAIDFAQEDELVTRNYGAIAMATGFQMIDPSGFGEFGYGKSKDVLTSLEFERLMNAAGPTAGHLECPSDHRHPKDIVFIQCVGSRGELGAHQSVLCAERAGKHTVERVPADVVVAVAGRARKMPRSDLMFLKGGKHLGLVVFCHAFHARKLFGHLCLRGFYKTADLRCNAKARAQQVFPTAGQLVVAHVVRTFPHEKRR